MSRKSNDSEGFPPGFISTCGHLASVGRFFSWKRLSSWFFWSRAIILLTASLSFSSCSNVWREKKKNIILQTKKTVACYNYPMSLSSHSQPAKPSQIQTYCYRCVFFLSVIIAVSLKRGKNQVLPTHQLK